MPRGLPRLWIAATAALCLLAGPATAQAQQEKPPRPDQAVLEEMDPVQPPAARQSTYARCRTKTRAADEVILLDAAQRRLHQTVCGAALWFDGLFGEKGDLAAARKTYGRVEVATEYSEFNGSKTRVRFHARVQLPRLEERLSAFVGRDDEDDFVRDRSEGQALRSRNRQPSDRDEFLAGIGFASFTDENAQSDFKVGVRNVRLPKIFVQNRFSYIPYSTETRRVYLRNTPFWNNRDGWGVTQGLDFDNVLGQDFLLRWSNIATLTEETVGVDWRSALLLYQNLRGSSALGHELFIRGLTDAAEPVPEYGLRSVYRLPLFRERLFVEFTLGYSWPRNDPALVREGSALAGLGLEMPFGETPD